MILHLAVLVSVAVGALAAVGYALVRAAEWSSDRFGAWGRVIEWVILAVLAVVGVGVSAGIVLVAPKVIPT